MRVVDSALATSSARVLPKTSPTCSGRDGRLRTLNRERSIKALGKLIFAGQRSGNSTSKIDRLEVGTFEPVLAPRGRGLDGTCPAVEDAVDDRSRDREHGYRAGHNHRRQAIVCRCEVPGSYAAELSTGRAVAAPGGLVSPLRAPLLRTDHRSRSKTVPDQQVNVRVVGSRLDERLWFGHQPCACPLPPLGQPRTRGGTTDDYRFTSSCWPSGSSTPWCRRSRTSSS